MTPWELLLARLRNARKWPIPQEVPVRKWLRVWQALRENDEHTLRALMSWPDERPLIIDNLGEKIASAYGDLLFGNRPEFTPADETDADRLATMTQAWAPELRAAEETCASEGEVWWRLSMVPGIANAQLTWHSRWDVVPYLYGREALAAAFVSILPNPGRDEQAVWRHIEIQARGVTVNTLWVGRKDALGAMVPLARHSETALLPERWNHDLPFMLGGRVVNRWGRKPLVGVSIYKGVWQRLLALTEATTIGRENMRLTAKKRVIVPASAVRQSVPSVNDPRLAAALGAQVGSGFGVVDPTRPMPRAQFDAGEDVMVNDPLDADEGGGRDPFRVLEYSFEASELTTWIQFEISTIAQRCDLVPQFIGDGDFGSAASGTALRVRLLPTTNAAEGRGEHWDQALPIVAQRGAMLEALPQPLGGASEAWADPVTLPAVEREDALPADETEIATRQATLKTADLISIETALRERYQDRDDTWIAAEVERIRADQASTLPAATTFGP